MLRPCKPAAKPAPATRRVAELTQAALTKDDVEHLLGDPSPTVKAQTAAKVALLFREGRLTPEERCIAEDIFRVMVEDIHLEVRETLAFHLRNSTLLPHNIALIMARDVESVAVPVLEVSEVLTEQDLIDIVRAEGTIKRLAVARRRQVPTALSDALIGTEEEEVVITLLANEGAKITEDSLHKVVDAFGRSEAVHEPLVRRARLPMTVVERLVALVSDGLRRHLVTHHRLPSAMAENIVLQSREAVLTDLIPACADPAEIERLVTQLSAANRLTPTFLLRALYNEEVLLFEAGLAAAARLPMEQVRRLIRDPGPLGLKEVYDRSSLPTPLYPAFRIAVDVIIRGDAAPADGESRDRRIRRILDRLLAQYEDVEPRELELVLTRLYRRVYDGEEAAKAGALAH